MYLSSTIKLSVKALTKLSKSGLDWCSFRWCALFFFLDQVLGQGMKNVIDAPDAGKEKPIRLASANKVILYSLYLSKRSSLFSPGGLNLSLGIRKNILSPCVALTWVWGVTLRISVFRSTLSCFFFHSNCQ